MRTAALLALVLLLGWIRAQPDDTPRMEDVLDGRRGALVTISGTVLGDPLPVHGIRNTPCRFPLRVELVALDGDKTQSVVGRIEVLWFGRLGYGSSPAYGERWDLEGRLRAAGNTDRSDQLCLVSGKRQSERVSRGAMAAIVQSCLALRNGAARTLRQGVEDYPDAVGMVQALLLGCRSEVSKEAHGLFVRTGTLHIFAISGLHVGIVVGLVIFMLAVMSIPRRWWVFIVAPLLIAYALVTGMKPSAIRACIMAIVFLSAAALHRKADGFAALAFAAILLLLFSPGMLMDASFVLSFSVVTGILLLYPLLEKALRPLWEPDPFAVEREAWAVRVMRGFGRRAAALLSVSVAAWLVSAPLIAVYFGRVAPVGLLANVFVVPMAFLIVLSGSLSIVLGLFITMGADLFNHASLALSQFLMAGLRVLALIPGGCVKVGSVPLWAPVLWYGLLAMVVLYLHAVSGGTQSGQRELH